MMPASPHLIDRVQALLDDVQSTRIDVPRDTGLLRIEPRLMDEILRMLSDAAELMGDLVALYDGHEGERTAVQLAPQELADLAFVSRGELFELRGSLANAVEAQNIWKMAALGERSLARLTRSLGPVDTTLRQMHGLDPVPRRSFDLDDALEIRRQYSRFWLEGVRLGSPAPEEIRDRLEHFADMISELRQHPIYPFLWIEDRLELRRLQKRVLRALESETLDPTGALRLWQDMFGFFRLLMQIHRREELREHDQELVGRVLREIGDPATAPQQLSRPMHEALQHLASQSPDLDRLLVRASPADSQAYREPLRQLARTLAGL